MNQPSLQGTNPTLDLTAGLGYGLIYQAILGTPSTNAFAMQFQGSHRQDLHRLYEKRKRAK